MNNLLESCFGYDTLKMSVNVNHSDRETICNVAQFKPFYDNYRASLSNLDLFLTENHLSVTGSFPQFLTGQNVQVSSISELKNGIEILSDTLHLGFSDAYISRIDIATTIETDFSPHRYFEFLGNLGRCERNPIKKTTLQYTKGTKNNGLYKLMFYDKGKELQKGKKKILANDNLLRIESRLEKKTIKAIAVPLSN